MVRFPNGLLNAVFQIQRENESLGILPFQSPLFRVLWTWFESLRGRLWVHETSKAFKIFFSIRWISIWEHLDRRYEF